MTTLLVGAAAAQQVAARPAAPEAGQFAAWRAAIKKALYIPANLPPLETKVWSSFTPTEGVVADRVTYRTSRGMIVPAIVYRPEHWKNQDKGAKLPGMVVVNGHGGDKYSWYAFYSGMMFAKAGAEVVTYDPIGEGERNIEKKSRASSHDKIVAVPEGVPPDDWGQRLAGLMQVDLMQAVSYLDSRPEVDSKRIAVLGYSMGAFVSGIAGAIDPRIHAVLLSGGGTFDDAADGGKSYDVGLLPCQAPPWRSLKVLGDAPHMRGAVLYALNAERGPMLVENGSADTVMDIPHRTPEWFAGLRAQAVELDKATGGTAANMFTTHVDAEKSHRTAWVERYGAEWLNDQIHFANWTDAQMARMPTTHVSEWIAANKVDISKGYLREDREGGLECSGNGVSRADPRPAERTARGGVAEAGRSADLRELGREDDGSGARIRRVVTAADAANRAQAKPMTMHSETITNLQRSVLAANLELVAHGLVLFTFGNASGIDRDSNTIVIKPSGVDYAKLRPEDMVVCSLDGKLSNGSLRPSSDLDTHLHLYREFPAIGAVVHTHSTYATAWAQAGREIPAYGTTHADYFHGPVPVTADLTDEEIDGDYVLNTGKQITRRFLGVSPPLDPLAIPAVLVRGHAPFAWGRTPHDAAHNAIVLEAVAKMGFLTDRLQQGCAPVSQALLDRHYHRKHGPKATYGQAG